MNIESAINEQIKILHVLKYHAFLDKARKVSMETTFNYRDAKSKK